MTYEYAEYFKLLLLCGYKEELQRYIDDALNEQDPLSDIILSLSTVGNDDNKILSVLNEYLMQANDSDIDYNETVFELIIAFLKKKYYEDSMPMDKLTDLMYKLALNTEKELEDPWYTMYLMKDLFDDSETGYTDKESYLKNFEAFINDKTLFSDCPALPPKESFFKRMIRKIRRHK